MIRMLLLLVVVSGLLGCNDDGERPEQLLKLRALGVAAQPTVITPSTDSVPSVARLTFYAAVPEGQEVATEVFEDLPAFNSLPLSQLQLDDTTITYTDLAKIRLYEVSGTFVAPTADTLAKGIGGVLRLRYSVRLTSGDEEEKVVGDVLMVAADSAEAQWTAPVLSFEEPTETSITAGKDNAVKASVTDVNDERVKVGWFVTSGKVENRRARATKWQEPSAGEQTVIVTARGIRSRGFALTHKVVSAN